MVFSVLAEFGVDAADELRFFLAQPSRIDAACRVARLFYDPIEQHIVGDRNGGQSMKQLQFPGHLRIRAERFFQDRYAFVGGIPKSPDHDLERVGHTYNFCRTAGVSGYTRPGRASGRGVFLHAQSDQNRASGRRPGAHDG